MKPTVTKAKARAISKRGIKRAHLERRPGSWCCSASSSTLAWETMVTGRKHGEATRQTVYVGARTGRVLDRREHVLNGTGNGGLQRARSRIPTTLSGSTYSMRNPSATTLVCQDAANNTTFSGPDDVWGNGSPTSKETGCVDALFAAQKSARCCRRGSAATA